MQCPVPRWSTSGCARRSKPSRPRAWRAAVDGDGTEREGAQVTELTDHLDLSTWPEGTRLIVRRERPIPAPSPRSSTARPITATPPSSPTRPLRTSPPWNCATAAGPAWARSASARRPEWGGCPSPPSPTTRPGWRSRCWRKPCCAGPPCSAWMGSSRLAEPKRVRHRLLHVAGRLVLSGRRMALRPPQSWP